MSVNQIDLPISPEALWSVLSDPESYGHWVVGAADIRDADATWPAPGATFHHTQGIRGVGLKDSTTVLEAQAPRRLVLEVRARPVVIAKVTLDLAPNAGGTHVTMTEWPIGGWLAKIYRPRMDGMITARNDVSLKRLARLAERR